MKLVLFIYFLPSFLPNFLSPFLLLSFSFILQFSVMLLPYVLLSFGLLAQVWAHPQPPSEPGHLGAVASESAVCSKIGTDVLEEGGNAADAVSI